MNQPELEEMNGLCRVYCRLKCVFEHDYTEAINKVLDGKASLGSAMELEKTGINACVKDCFTRCLTMSEDPQKTWLGLYDKALRLFAVMNASVDIGNIATVLQHINNLDEMSVAEFKGLLDYLCKAHRESESGE